ncbi:MAG TPA: hypothetical protein DDW52_02430 [Planctomycetaceae bacterium]|nr:hypothetical protein [Planctomycetaceae bacterium]
MKIQNWLNGLAQSGYSSLAGSFQAAGSGVNYLSELAGNMRLFGSSISGGYEQQVDERHYLLVPDARNPDGYSIVVLRVLPDDVPPINDLPKRRLLHLPNLESEAMLRHLLVEQAKSQELAKPQDGKTLACRARELADAIDALDKQVFGGVLLIGGLVAVFNPVAGAAIAAKSLIPSLAMFASKYGLQVAEEKLSDAEMARRAKEAETTLAKEFTQSDTRVVVNDLLDVLQRALVTNEADFDPMLAFVEIRQSDEEPEQRRFQKIAAQAIVGVYADALGDPTEQNLAQLGPEDLRFLRLLQSTWA